MTPPVDWHGWPDEEFAAVGRALMTLGEVANTLDSATSSALSQLPGTADKLVTASQLARSAAATLARIPGVIPVRPPEDDDPA